MQLDSQQTSASFSNEEPPSRSIGQSFGEQNDPCATINHRESEANKEENALDKSSDPVFQQEQYHLDETYETLKTMGRNLVSHMEKAASEAASDKRSMSEELSPNFATYADAMETYADFAAMNRVIDGYNASQEANAEQLRVIRLLLRQPYFAKVVLQFKPDQEPKELYIGNAGISDESYRRLIVDWRSPVAETYYNQADGRTSYRADGRVITADLKLRRQFDIEENRLNAYFDTSVAIQDSLLLASLSKRRTAQMQAITATIQREQNLVVRHEDVPVLLVSGIAGSGKTSVLLQRIAYLLYQNRGDLDPREVFLITPNDIFRDYVAKVLPDLGESNPQILTWSELAHQLLQDDRGSGDMNVPLEALGRIDKALASFDFEPNDFRDVRCADTRLVGADQINKLSTKFRHIPAGPHRVTLMREDLHTRLQSRLKQLAATDEILDELSALSIEDQVRIFHETIEPQNEQEERAYALRYLNDRYAAAFASVEHDDWLRIDRIGMRLLGTAGLRPLEWLYLKMALTGMSNPRARYVMIDEVQDYTPAQLTVLARYFRRANFLLLGDPNQAIEEGTASFDQIGSVFSTLSGHIETCQLLTSYRSTPEITKLFASLLDDEDRMRISSIQRAEEAPTIISRLGKTRYEAELRRAIDQARQDEGLTAVIVPWKQEAKRLQSMLGDAAPTLVDGKGTLPASGVMMITLGLAKGLEFDQVIVPDASERAFPDTPLSRRRLYTTLSRAMRKITVLAQDELTPLLECRESPHACPPIDSIFEGDHDMPLLEG